MSEPKKEIALKLAEVFIKKFNQDFDKDFIFDHQDEKNQDYDFLFKKNGETLQVQLVEAVPVRGRELKGLKEFENGNIQSCGILRLQTDELRVEESLGKKLNHHYSTENKLVILIDFGSFAWDQDNLVEMRNKADEFKGKFKNVYCVHLGKNICERLV